MSHLNTRVLMIFLRYLKFNLLFLMIFQSSCLFFTIKDKQIQLNGLKHQKSESLPAPKQALIFLGIDYLHEDIRQNKEKQQSYIFTIISLLISFVALEFLNFRIISLPSDVQAYAREKQQEWITRGSSVTVARIKLEVFYLDAFFGYVKAEIENVFLEWHSLN